MLPCPPPQVQQQQAAQLPVQQPYVALKQPVTARGSQLFLSGLFAGKSMAGKVIEFIIETKRVSDCCCGSVMLRF